MVKVRVTLEDGTEELHNYRVDEIIVTQDKDSKYEDKKNLLKNAVKNLKILKR